MRETWNEKNERTIEMMNDEREKIRRVYLRSNNNNEKQRKFKIRESEIEAKRLRWRHKRGLEAIYRLYLFIKIHKSRNFFVFLSRLPVYTLYCIYNHKSSS